jgi:hypothetical protein
MNHFAVKGIMSDSHCSFVHLSALIRILRVELVSRAPKRHRISKALLVLIFLISIWQSQISAQLPDAPLPTQATSQMEPNGPQQAGTGEISGTVRDTNGDVVEGAQVTLWGSVGFTKQIVVSGSDGQFAFTGLPPAVYKITVSGQGMSTFTSSPIPLRSDQALIVPQITLAVSGGSTSVTVNGNKEEMAEEQVRIAVQQRVVGIIPNFYSSYDWNAPPMEAKQKLQLGIRSVLDPVSFLSVAGIAGAEQYENVFPAYGSGIEGYGKRYGAALATHASADLLSRAVYPAIFHQDPRYFYKGKGSIRSRALYAISAAVMARDDDGRWRPNYSNVLGNFSAGAISNLYYPSSDRGASLVFLNGLADTGGDAVANLVREFLLKRFTSHAPKGATGQP